jgi:hypothetical protein
MTWFSDEINYKCKILKDIENTRIGRLLIPELRTRGINPSETTLKSWLVGQYPPHPMVEEAVKMALESVRQDIQKQSQNSPLNSPAGALRF